MFNFPGKVPSTLGISSGSLALCPNKPNCVCSIEPIDDDAALVDSPHMVQPFRFSGSVSEAFDRLEMLISNNSKSVTVTRIDDYMHITVTSAFFGWVDDMEFHALPSEGTIHVRSASRVGYSDFGVNRARIESLRNTFEVA